MTSRGMVRAKKMPRIRTSVERWLFRQRRLAADPSRSKDTPAMKKRRLQYPKKLRTTVQL